MNKEGHVKYFTFDEWRQHGSGKGEASWTPFYIDDLFTEWKPNIILQLDLVVVLDSSFNMVRWLSNHCKGNFYCWNVWTYMFELDEDYVLFKLRWL
jgi:hypothetical protein